VRSQNLLECVTAKNLAANHLFERASVARELHAAGMLRRRGIGRVSVEDERILAKTDGRFIRVTENLLTTREVLAEEGHCWKPLKPARGSMTNWAAAASGGFYPRS
jgi:hypothetical protein